MTGAIVEILVWLVAGPALIGAVKAWRLNAANRQAGNPGFAPRDWFEIKNDTFAAAAFFCPMALGYAFFAADMSLSALPWWTAFAGVIVVGCLPMLAYGRWYQKSRKLLGTEE